MWLEAEAPHRRIINSARIDSLYVAFKRYGEWAVVASVGSADYVVGRFATKAEADEHISAVREKLELD